MSDAPPQSPFSVSRSEAALLPQDALTATPPHDAVPASTVTAATAASSGASSPSSASASTPEPAPVQMEPIAPAPAPAAAAASGSGSANGSSNSGGATSGLRSRQVDDSGRIRIGVSTKQPAVRTARVSDPAPTAGPSQSFFDFATGKQATGVDTRPHPDDAWWDDTTAYNTTATANAKHSAEGGRERLASVTHGRGIGRLGGHEATGSRFCLRYFLQQFFAHIFLPFSLPFFVAIEGKIRAQNQALWPAPNANWRQGIRSFFGQNLFPIIWWFIVLLRAVRAPEGVSDVEFYIAVFGYVAHRLVLATKYALLTDDYTRALGRRLISANVHRNIELVTGWATPSIEVCDRELRTAGRKLGIHLERVGVILNKGELDVPDPRTGEPGEPPRGTMQPAEQCADPLLGVGLTSVADRQLDPAVTPEAGPVRHGSVLITHGPAGGGGAVQARGAAPLEGVVVQPTGASGSDFGGAIVPDAAAAAAASASARPSSTAAAAAAGGGMGSGSKPPLPSKPESKSSLFTKGDVATKDVKAFYADRGLQAVSAVVASPASGARGGAGAVAAGAGAGGDATASAATVTLDDAEQVRMSGLFLATRIVRELCVNSPAAKVKYWLALAIAFVQMCLPIVVRTGQTGGSVFGSSNWDSIALVCACAFLTFAFTTILCLFVLVGVADYYRRYALMKVLGVMIDPTTNTAARDDDIEHAFKHLFIDLAIPSNIPGWFAIRQVIHEFGINYRVRIQLYTSYSLVLAFGLFVVILVNIARGTEPDYVFISSVSLNSVTIFLLLASMVYYGGRANEQYSVHQSILVRVQFAIREALAETMPFALNANNFHNVEYETLKQCESLIESVLKCLEMGNSTNPVTIMGVRASDQVFTALGGFAATAFGTAARVLSNGG